MAKKVKKNFCPYCGEEITQEETEYGVVCPKCHNEFWLSECLPENWKEEGYVLMNDMLK